MGPQASSLWRRAVNAISPRARVRHAFTEHYRRWDWGEPETVSGPGSTHERTAVIREQIPRLLAELGVRRVLDAGCGDLNWFPTMDLKLDAYIGTDVVPELVAQLDERFGGSGREFLCRDLTRDPLPAVDLIFCRDCLVHLPNRLVQAALDNFAQSGSTYLLTTTFTGDHPNEDIPMGGWRPLNLQRAPFELPAPLHFISERRNVEDGRYADKSLGLWRLTSV